MEDSIFTKILKGTIPGNKIYEDDHVFALLDIQPANKGHCLVIPKEQVENIDQCSPELLGHLMNGVKKVGGAIKQALNVPAYNVLVNNGKEAGQVVFHLHLHVIPRFTGDNVNLQWNHEKYEEGEMIELEEKIKISL